MLSPEQIQEAAQQFGPPPSAKNASPTASKDFDWDTFLGKSGPASSTSNTPASSASPSFEEQHPILGGVKSGLENIGGAIASTVTQPAKALQSLGTGLGEVTAEHLQMPFAKQLAGALGFTPENAAATKAALETGATPAKTPEQAAGVGIQAAANLATPAALAAGPAGLAAQTAALSGGQAMEQGKGAADVGINAALGGALGGALGKGTEFAGNLVSKGAQALKEAAAPIVEKTMPFLSNVPKGFITFAKANPELVLPKMQTMAKALESGDPATAESALREELLSHARDIHAQAKNVAETAYKNGVDAVKQKFPDAQGSVEAMRGSLRALVKEAGPVIGQENEQAMKAIANTLKGQKTASVDGLIGLKRNLASIVDQTEQGTPAYRTANLMMNEVDNELNRITKGAMKPINKAYAAFKNDQAQIKPVWSNSAKEDTARNFVNGLESQAKGGSLDAMKRLEKLAGATKSITDQIKATKIAKAFNWEKAPPGSRIRDQLMSNAISAGGTALGGMIGAKKHGVEGGFEGAGIGSVLGSVIGGKVTSPAVLSKLLMSQFEESGAPVTNEVRQWIGKAISNPATATALRNMILGLTGTQPTE